MNKTDDKGSTPLHIAAEYGNLNSLELLIKCRANLFSLDNNGRTAARVAAFFQKADCCRYLDTTAMRWQKMNESAVSKMQIKAMNDLKKRSKKILEEGRDGRPKKISYDYSTAPVNSAPHHLQNVDRRASATENSTFTNRKLSHEDALRQNFELRSGQNGKEESEESASITGNPFHNLSRIRTGPLLNNLSQLPMKLEQTEDGIDPYNSSSDGHQGMKRGKKSLPELELTGGHPAVTQNESALATFLHSLDLVDSVQLLHREKLDLDALSMCSEMDLSAIGLSLGPRKKILHGVARRKAVLASSGLRMTDTEF